jgi:hypothetical protein
MADSGWDPETALRRLAEETNILRSTDGDPTSTADEILRSAAPEAALSMVWMAVHSKDERVRYNASKFVLDKILPDKKFGPVDDPWTAIYEAMAKATDAK